MTLMPAMGYLRLLLEIRDMNVPNSEHLNVVPVLTGIAQEVLQEDIGGQVWIITPKNEVWPGLPTATKDGGAK